MAIDDRKQRILMAIVSLYNNDGEPVGSNLLSRYFDMAVSSATLRNEMAALTKLGLLDQPHTSAGRVPTPKGYRYFVENLLTVPDELAPRKQLEIDEIFRTLDYDTEKLAQGVAKAISDKLQCAVVTTTPRAENVSVAHFEVVQVGLYTAAVLAVTSVGGVRTRVAKVNFELTSEDILYAEAILNKTLRFVSEADISPSRVLRIAEAFESPHGSYAPFLSAALTLLAEISSPSIYVEGQQHFLHWPELTEYLPRVMELFNNPDMLDNFIQPQGNHTTVRFGDELSKPIPDLCLITRRYFAGGGLTGNIAIAGPIRMNFREIIPQLEYISAKMGETLSGTS